MAPPNGKTRMTASQASETPTGSRRWITRSEKPTRRSQSARNTECAAQCVRSNMVGPSGREYLWQSAIGSCLMVTVQIGHDRGNALAQMPEVWFMAALLSD